MIVKFYHPGEVDKKSLKKKDDRYKKKHKRKLIINQISYLNEYDKVCTTESGYFWGEWEAESVCDKQDGFYVHTVKCPSKIVINENPTSCGGCGVCGKKPLNTDPYVFGDHFIYSNCKQDRYEKLKELKPNDLIVFGSHKNNTFILDTVFVVGGKISISDCSECFKNATGNLIKDGSYTIYKGKTFEDCKDMFSFFPCSTQPFERPKILIKGTNDAQKQGVAYVSKAGSKEVWDSIKKQVISQGCILGINAKEPKENDK